MAVTATQTITAYRITTHIPLVLEPAPQKRLWMDATPDGFAKRCLPLLIANQAGWVVRLTESVVCSWDGQDGPGNLSVTEGVSASSHFGSGILTFSLPWIFRTPQDVSLLVTGPFNTPTEGRTALTGIVETDWAVATFTMNWQLDRTGAHRFMHGDPIAQILPVRLDVEDYTAEIRSITTDPELHEAFLAWQESRYRFNNDPARGTTWEGDFFRGTSPSGASAPEGRHKTRLHVRPFTGG